MSQTIRNNDRDIDPKPVLESTAIRYLSFRPRFKAEVATRLAKKSQEIGLKDPLSLIDQILGSLEASGFIDDEKLLERFIVTRLTEKLKGPYWIKMRLLRFGLDRPSIERGLKKYASIADQKQALKKFITKRAIGKNLDMKQKSRLYRLLISRGFSRDLVYQIFDQNDSLE